MTTSPPLVSILLPTHNRPDYMPLALESVLAQTYTNIEVIISDNGSTDVSHDLLQPYLQRDRRIQYHRIAPGGVYLDNWLNALHRAQGEYVNFLMDDDLFAPTKVERMVGYFRGYQNIGLVTSFRQLIDGEGRHLQPLPGTQRLFESDSVITGATLFDHIIRTGTNVVGEPTTAMVRRADIGNHFGRFAGYQYMTLSDVATWLHVTTGRHCVYIAEALSSFRLHGAQDQRKSGTAIVAQLEWLRLLLDGHERGLCMPDHAQYRDHLGNKLPSLVHFLASRRADMGDGRFDVPEIQALVARALGELLAPTSAPTAPSAPALMSPAETRVTEAMAA